MALMTWMSTMRRLIPKKQSPRLPKQRRQQRRQPHSLLPNSFRLGLGTNRARKMML